MNKKIYTSAVENIRVSEDLSESILDYLSSLSQSHEESLYKKSKIKKIYLAFTAVTCALVLLVGIQVYKSSSDFELPNSVGNVSVKYIDKAPALFTSYSLVSLTEDEIFHKYNTEIFMGTIEDIQNIKISFNRDTLYQAIAQIRIDKIYRGSETVGNTVSVLLPCPIGTNYRITSTEVTSSIRVGMTGIFMPVKYDDTFYREENGARIYWIDIAEYGFMDGERYAFLNSEDGLIFDQNAFESIAHATTMEEIEEYILKMIE